MSDDLNPGEGKVVQKQGKDVAVYKGEDGTLSEFSAVCPHADCLVEWDKGEKVWYCPCHGSEFKPTGEVITGPAEEALHKAR